MQVDFTGPFKIAKFSITKIYEDSNVVIDYEIPPGEMNSRNGWIDYTADSFEDPDIKEAISIAEIEWTAEIRSAYKSYVMETYIPSISENVTLTYDQIDALLNDIIAKDGSIT